MAEELKYKPEYCEKLIDHMKQGYSFETFGPHVDVCKTTLYNWVEKYPEFKKAKDKAFQLAKEYFESHLLKKVEGKSKGDTTAMIFALKTRFHETYGEKKEVSINIDGPEFVDE